MAQTDWPTYGHDPGGQRYSPLRQIDTTNVTHLARAWTFHTGEQVSNADYRDQKIAAFETTPVVIDNTLYFSTPGDSVIALNATTGEQLWRFDAQAPDRRRQFHSHRGDGRQYVVIAAGGGGFFSAKGSDVLAAYALPSGRGRPMVAKQGQ